MEWNIPEYVDRIIDKLESNGFSAYIVGGSVRDILIGREPSDYDVSTDALPNEIEEVFQEYKTLEVGKEFGTIVVVQDEGIVEVTTFRSDGAYIDGRRPEKVYFSKNIIDDLSRRDFTINSMAYNKSVGLIDYFQGKEDLGKRQIKTVGNPNERFQEDYLRIMRAIRFAAQLEFSIEESTFQACKSHGEYIDNISKERVREEFFKILLCRVPSNGINLMKDSGVLSIVLPEIMDTVDFNQHNPHHDKDVFQHTICVLDNTKPILELRLAALLHDIGKPHTLTIDEEGIGHFYNHNKIGAKIAEKILKRLKSPNELIETVSLLIYKHMIQHDNLGKKGLKRLLGTMGEERIFTLLKLNKADRLCSNKNARISDLIEREEEIKKIIENKEVYEKKQLTINGHDVIKLGYKEGKEIGEILNYLLEKVLEDPGLNNKKDLIEIIKYKFKASEN